MAYDVDRKPPQWVGQEAKRHARGVYFIVGLGLVSLVSLVHALSPARTIIGGVAILLAVALLKVIGESKLDLAVRFRLGWAAEKSVGDELNLLRSDGFVVMHDIPQAGEGNIDHIVSGPTGIYLIETKARSYREEALGKARRQAAKLHDELGTWVTPVICIDQRPRKPFRHDRVWIVPRAHVLEWIRAQKHQEVSFERLARYADKL